MTKSTNNDALMQGQPCLRWSWCIVHHDPEGDMTQHTGERHDLALDDDGRQHHAYLTAEPGEADARVAFAVDGGADSVMRFNAGIVDRLVDALGDYGDRPGATYQLAKLAAAQHRAVIERQEAIDADLSMS